MEIPVEPEIQMPPKTNRTKRRSSEDKLAEAGRINAKAAEDALDALHLYLETATPKKRKAEILQQHPDFGQLDGETDDEWANRLKAIAGLRRRQGRNQPQGGNSMGNGGRKYAADRASKAVEREFQPEKLGEDCPRFFEYLKQTVEHEHGVWRYCGAEEWKITPPESAKT